MMYVIRKNMLNILLPIIFFLFVIAIIAPLAAEIEADVARKACSTGDFIKAEAGFKKAISIDRFNSSYFSEMGKCLVKKGISQNKEEVSEYLQRAVKSYEKASELNRQLASHTLELGHTYIRLFLNNTKDVVYKNNAFLNFKRATRDDPNGFITSYSIGYTGMGIWQFLEKKEQSLVLDKLKLALKAKPSYGKYIYPHVWRHTKNFEFIEKITSQTLTGNIYMYTFLRDSNLWDFRKKVADKIKFYLKKEDPGKLKTEMLGRKKEIEEIKKSKDKKAIPLDLILQKEWRGKDLAGKNLYENGEMYWTGRIDALLVLPSGKVAIQIQAKGTPAEDIYPYMVVELDGEEVGETFVNSSEWKEYRFTADTDGGPKVLSVKFLNDFVNTEKNEDRNLYIGETWIEK